MSDSTTKRMQAPFVEMAPAAMFLSGFFQSPPSNYHNSETVEIDIQRDGEEVAIAITDLSTGRRYNENSEYSNKEYKPPAYDEELVLNSFDMLKREPGSDPFEDPDYQAVAILRAFRGFTKLQNKIRRAIELQASQVLQTGVMTCIDAGGNAITTINFQPKDAHFDTVGTSWGSDGSTGDPIEDLGGLAQVIRGDGHRNPDSLIFGHSAWLRFVKNTKVQPFLTRDGLGLGQLNPQTRGQGGTFQGVVTIGAYQFNCWTYNGRYKHPQSGVSTPFVENTNVIMMSSQARLDLTFGNIPILFPEQRVLQLPTRLMDTSRGIDLTVHSWVEKGGKELHVSAGTRPLCQPTEIDSFGCLDVESGGGGG